VLAFFTGIHPTTLRYYQAGLYPVHGIGQEHARLLWRYKADSVLAWEILGDLRKTPVEGFPVEERAPRNLEAYLLLQLFYMRTRGPHIRVISRNRIDGIDNLFPTNIMFHQQGMVCFSCHNLELGGGDFADGIDRERVGDGHACFFVKAIAASDGENSDWIILKEGGRNEEFLKFRDNTPCHVFARELEEVVHQPQICDDGGVDRIDELKEGFEDLGGFGDFDDTESGILRRMVRWLGDGEGVSEDARCDREDDFVNTEVLELIRPQVKRGSEDRIRIGAVERAGGRHRG